jgi:L-cysteine/cystine lyase
LLREPPPAGLVSFTLQDDAGTPRDTAAVVDSLGRQGIWIRRLDQPDCLRACVHITTTTAEIDQLLAALAGMQRQLS